MNIRTILAVLCIFPVIVFGKTIELDGQGITFEAPDEFLAVPQEIIDLKYPSKNAPRFVIGNKNAATTIAYDLKPQDLSGVEMDEILIAFEATFSRVIPGITWIEKKVIKQSGREWAFLEMTSNAIDTDIYNIMLVTGFRKQMLIFNFNSTKEEFPKYEEILRESLKSIKLPDES